MYVKAVIVYCFFQRRVDKENLPPATLITPPFSDEVKKLALETPPTSPDGEETVLATPQRPLDGQEIDLETLQGSQNEMELSSSEQEDNENVDPSWSSAISDKGRNAHS